MVSVDVNSPLCEKGLLIVIGYEMKSVYETTYSLVLLCEMKEFLIVLILEMKRFFYGYLLVWVLR